MRYKISHATTYSYSETVPVCHNEVRLEPRDHPRQTCLRTRLMVRPRPTDLSRRLDYFGNPATCFSIQEGHLRLSVTAVSKVELTPPVWPEPAATPPWEAVRERLRVPADSAAMEAVPWLYDSPQAAASPALAHYAAPSFPPGRPLLAGVLDLTGRIFREFTYDPTATTVSTPLAEVLRHRRGVCQDFAHLEIGCLRSLGLAARYISGYLLTEPPPGQPKLLGADASHAWLSVWCPPDVWIDVDPTNNLLPGLGHVTLAWGRDYQDVCPIKGVFIGGGHHTMQVAVDVVPDR